MDKLYTLLIIIIFVFVVSIGQSLFEKNEIATLKFKESMNYAMGEDITDVLIIRNSRISMYKDRLVKESEKLIGTPYLWGGSSLSDGGLDCSGFIRLISVKSGVPVPRSVTSKMALWTKSSEQKANLPLFDAKGRDMISHVGVWSDNGNEFIHASTSKGVIKSELDLWWGKNNRYKYSVILPSLEGF